MDDKQLRQHIVDELEFDPRINAANIGVAVNNGVVTLTGHVSSYVEKVAAEKATRRVKGVRALAEELEVRYPNDKKTADDEIAKRALKILEWYDLISGNGIQVDDSTRMGDPERRGHVAVSKEGRRECRSKAVGHCRRGQQHPH